MSDELDPTFYEKLLIKYMFMDKEVREKLIPYLTVDVFDDSACIDIVKLIQKHMEEYQKFPSAKQLKLVMDGSTWNELVDISNIDTSEYDKDFILDQLEEFFRNKLANEVILEARDGLVNDDRAKLNAAPDKLREALAFTFDTNIGLSVLTDAERMYNSLHDRDKVVSTGLQTLDDLIEGGFHEKSLSLVLAESNLGKSLIKCSLATNSLLQNKNVLYLSLEMSEEKISERVLANLFDINLSDLKMLDKNKFMVKLQEHQQKLESNFYVVAYPPKSINANRIRSILKELHLKKKFVPDIIFVDYLGLMSPNATNKNSNTYSEQKTISEELRAIAVEFGMPIVSAVQTNRNGFGNAELDLTDIADSVGTVATADIIFGVTQTQEMRDSGRYSFLLLKNRYGENKKKRYIGVDYPKMRIYDVKDDSNEDRTIPKAPPEELVSNLMRKDRQNGKGKIINFE